LEEKKDTNMPFKDVRAEIMEEMLGAQVVEQVHTLFLLELLVDISLPVSIIIHEL